MARERALLRTKLLKWLLVPLLLLLTADALVSYWIGLRFSERAYDRALVELAREVSLHLASNGAELSFDMPEAARAVLFTDPSDRMFYEIVDDRGRIVAGAPITVRPAGRANAGSVTVSDGEIDGAPVRIVELRVAPGAPQNASPAVVRVAETKIKRNELTREFVFSVVAPQVLLILLVVTVVWIGVIRGLSPLARLQGAIAARSYHDRSPVTVSEVPGEVRPLLEEINQLLGRLDHALSLQDRFIADAAHQLKTPVAALQAQIEVALGESESARARESLTRVSAGVNRISRLVSQLLSLARNEPAALRTMSLVPVDVAAVAFATTGDWVDAALLRNIDIGFEGENSGLMIEGDPARLRELFGNLIDNAVRYTPPNGRVTVQVCREPLLAVRISDDGPTIPPEERQRVFERFHRVLGSGQEGSGLGLAIAHEIARLHDAEITLTDDSDGVGNTFTVTFRQTMPDAHAGGVDAV